jgi:non-specific serine/threonine protein kinase
MSASTRSDGRLRSLTRREREVASLIVCGYTNREIAHSLVIAERTAETHLEHIYSKLEVRSRAQLASWVTQLEPGALADAGQSERRRPGGP